MQPTWKLYIKNRFYLPRSNSTTCRVRLGSKNPVDGQVRSSMGWRGKKINGFLFIQSDSDGWSDLCEVLQWEHRLLRQHRRLRRRQLLHEGQPAPSAELHVGVETLLQTVLNYTARSTHSRNVNLQGPLKIAGAAWHILLKGKWDVRMRQWHCFYNFSHCKFFCLRPHPPYAEDMPILMTTESTALH